MWQPRRTVSHLAHFNAERVPAADRAASLAEAGAREVAYLLQGQAECPQGAHHPGAPQRLFAEQAVVPRAPPGGVDEPMSS